MTFKQIATVRRLTLLTMIACTVGAAQTIVVNSGPFPNAHAAAQAEDRVNWLDADLSDDNACTECFAALVSVQERMRSP
jgi:hypothetical protein